MAEASQKLPNVPAELLSWLRKTFPLRPPDITAPNREVWREAGRQHIIDYLENLAKRRAEESSMHRLET